MSGITCQAVSSCGGCGKESERKQLLVCSGCKIRRYCDVKCQKKEWKEHKKDCPEMKAAYEQNNRIFKHLHHGIFRISSHSQAVMNSIWDTYRFVFCVQYVGNDANISRQQLVTYIDEAIAMMEESAVDAIMDIREDSHRGIKPEKMHPEVQVAALSYKHFINDEKWGQLVLTNRNLVLLSAWRNKEGYPIQAMAVCNKFVNK